MKLKSSGLIMISVLIARSAAQTEAGSGEEEEGGSGSGEGPGLSTEVINSAEYSMTASDGSLDIRSGLTALNISQSSPVFLVGSV